MKSYQSPPTAPAGIDSPEIAKPGNEGRALRQQRLLDGARLVLLVAHALPLVPFMLEAPRVVHGHGNVIAQTLQPAQMLAGKGVQFVVRSRKHAHQLTIHQ